MLGIFNQSENFLMYGYICRYVVVMGNVWGFDRFYIYVFVKNFGRQVIFILMSFIVFCILVVGIV